AQAGERLLQIHAPRHRIERAELREHAVKFFERLVLDAAQGAIARPSGCLPESVKVLGPTARCNTAETPYYSVHVARRDLQLRAIGQCGPALDLEPVPAIALLVAQPAIRQRTLRSLAVTTDDEWRAQQSSRIGARALTGRELQDEQRCVDHRILRHRRGGSDDNGNRQRAAQRLPRSGNEDVLEDTAHFLASVRQIRQD